MVTPYAAEIAFVILSIMMTLSILGAVYVLQSNNIEQRTVGFLFCALSVFVFIITIAQAYRAGIIRFNTKTEASAVEAIPVPASFTPSAPSAEGFAFFKGIPVSPQKWLKVFQAFRATRDS